MTGREKHRILCVSRSLFQLREMRSAFPAMEYEVFTVSTPEQAVTVCLSNKVAAVVLDSEFSTEAGWSAAQTFKMVDPHLPVMLLLKSAEGTVPIGVDAVAPGPSQILPKLKGLLKRA
jgi:DNA-binding NtrC family response regulator